MPGLDNLADLVAADVGATPDATPASSQPSADPGGAPAGAERAEPAQAKDTKSDVESIVDKFLESHPAKDGNEWDPADPKPAPSDGADPAGRPGDSPDSTQDPDGTQPSAETRGEADLPDGKPADWLTKEEMAALGPKAKARIETLWRENREHRQFVEDADPFLKPLRDHGIPLADVEIMSGLVGAVNRGDWKTFYEAAKPYFDLAQQALGLALPEDLQRRVDDGEMTSEAASELSRTRHVAATAQVQAKQVTEARERDRQTEETRVSAENTAQVQRAVNDWETQERTSDPDYQRLRPLILDKMVAFVAQHGQPPTANDGVRLAVWAKQEVLKATRGAAPPARGTTRQPSPNGSAKAPLRAEPKDVYEHVFQRIGL